MPHVGGKTFGYDKAGVKAAKKHAKLTGQPLKVKKPKTAPKMPPGLGRMA
jgi:hypothetical protein